MKNGKSVYEEYGLDDIIERSVYYKFKGNNKMQNINWHSVRTFAGLAIIFVIAGLQALHNLVPNGSIIDTVVAVLLVIEHQLAGNTAPTS